jgi:competence protein ComEC
MILKKEIFVIVVLIFIAIVRFFFFLPKPMSYGSAIGKKVFVEGIVVNAPDIRLNNQRLTIRPTNQDSNILVVTSKDIKLSYGDKIKAIGILETPENFVTASGKEFNYERYLANQDIYFIIKNAEVEIISHNNDSKIISLLYRFRNAFMENIERVINPPKSDLANGLVLGSRGGFDNNTKNEFINTGTIHIIALSGYNVTIVAENVMKIFGLVFAQTISIILGIFVIILFILLAGASSTAIRAGIMASIALFARMTGRKYDAGRGLVTAGFLMIAYDPRVVTDISFQLSFIATFGVLFITPKVIGWVKFIPMRFGFRELVATTLGATIAVLPILLYSTGILSIVSIPANILILPLIPLTMFFVFITGVLGFVSTLLSIPFAYIAHLLLSYILGMIHFFASLPFASITIFYFPLIITIVLYAFIAWWVFIKKP